MRKHPAWIMSVVLVAIIGGNALATTTWTGGGDGTSWSDANNWNNGLPNGQQRVFINGVSTVTIDASVNDTINRFLLADGAGSDDVVVNMTGGSIDLSLSPDNERNLEVGTVGNAKFHMTGGLVNVAQHVRMAPDPGAPGVARLVMDGGAMNVGARLYVPYGPARTGIVELNGGVLTANQVFLADGAASNGLLTMTGGTLNAGDLWIPTNLDSVGSTGHLQLDGGIINVSRSFMMTNDIALGIKGTMDVTNGKMILPGDLTADPVLAGYISGGMLTAFGGAGDIVLNYQPGVGTELYAIPEPAGLLLLAVGGLLGLRRRR